VYVSLCHFELKASAYIHDRPRNQACTQDHTEHWWDEEHMAAIEMSEVPDEEEVTYSSPDIDVLSNTLDSGSLVEVSSYDTFPFSSVTALRGNDGLT
jgi:hypothetical protein